MQAFSAACRRLALLLGATAAAGCQIGPDELGEPTPGELGNVDFSYTECFLGCPVNEEPLMMGTTELITLRTNGPLPEIIVESSHPEILSVSRAEEPRDRVVVVQALAPGEASLIVRRDSGSMLDFVKLRVEPAALLALRVREPSGPWTSPEEVRLGAGEILGVGVLAESEKGEPLRASLGVELATTDPRVADLRFTAKSGDHEALFGARVVAVLSGKDEGMTRILARPVLRQPADPEGPLAELPVAVDE